MNRWDRHFLRIAYEVARMSKDRGSKHGAVLVRDKVILATGFNGFARGIDDEKPERHERPEKYNWAVHAEENAIINAARQGISTIDATLYVTGLPCRRCAQRIVNAGIRRVKYGPAKFQDIEEDRVHTARTCREAGVSLNELTPDW